MALLTSICDRMIALELGAVIAEGTPAQVLEHPRVVESYLGTDETSIQRSGAVDRPEPIAPGGTADPSSNGHRRHRAVPLRAR
jgi:ABC-type hemin transport system ATPase subunit